MKGIFPQYHIGHFLNQPDKPVEFALTRFEEMGELDIEDPHKHTFYEILWFDEGHSTQIIDYRTFDIAPGTLFFISPNQLHEFIEYQPLRGGSIFFTEHFFLLDNPDANRLFELSFLENFWEKPLLIPDNQSFVQIRQSIELLDAEYIRSDASPEILRALLRIVLAQIQRSATSGRSETVAQRPLIQFRAFKSLLEQHFHEAQTATFFARQLNMTQHHLNLICRQVAGTVNFGSKTVAHLFQPSGFGNRCPPRFF
jgi:AraC family transcriptional regulator, transcriptional activator of pobA